MNKPVSRPVSRVMTIRRLAPPLVLLLLAALGLLLVPALPAKVPIHWSLTGEPDRWADARVAVLVLPGAGLVTWTVIEAALALARRRKEGVAAVDRMAAVIQGGMTGFWAMLQAGTLAFHLGAPLPLGLPGLSLVATGGLVAGLGLYLRSEAGTEDGWHLVNLPVRTPEHARRLLRGVGAALLVVGLAFVLSAAFSGRIRAGLLLLTAVGSVGGLPLWTGWVLFRDRPSDDRAPHA